MSLTTQQTLTFTRYGEQTEDEYGFLVPGAQTSIETKGSLQPFRLGKTSTVTPEGVKPQDLRIYYTKTLLNSSDVDNQIPADTTTIGGEELVVVDNGDWTTNLSTLKHYKVILVRKEPS